MKVLFIGNSHTFFNDMPEMLRQLAAAKGIEIEAVQNTSGGMGLEWQARQFDVRYNILFGQYDYIVLQHVAHPFPGEVSLREGAEAVLKFVRLTSAQPVGYMTWSEEKYPEKQQEQTEAWLKLIGEQGLIAAPVGPVWHKLRHHPANLPLFFRDGEHAAPLGSYLIACVFFAVLTGLPLEDLPCAIHYSAPSFDASSLDDFLVGAKEHRFDPQHCRLIWQTITETLQEEPYR